jgi:hypothetical protein
MRPRPGVLMSIVTALFSVVAAASEATVSVPCG